MAIVDKLTLLFVLIFPFTRAFAQQTIKGRVVDSATGKVVQGASVFISNSSYGTTSTPEGTFFLTNLPLGRHELVITSIGYQTYTLVFHHSQLPLQLTVELRIKATELQNVIIEPSIEEDWNKWGRAFFEAFVGQASFAQECSIINTSSIRFRYYRKSNRLIAYCDEPILLRNEALGYLVKYQLENFEINFKEGSTQYFGYPFFTELKVYEKGPRPRINKNRERAYRGSILHFMRSVYDNILLEEGFEVRRLKRRLNLEKQRVIAAHNAGVYQKTDSLTGITKLYSDLPVDTLRYYQQVRMQVDIFEEYGASLLSADSLVRQLVDNYKIIGFPEYIHITYKRELQDTLYIKSLSQQIQPGYQRSFIQLSGASVVSIEANGNYYEPHHILSSGYWGWSERMCNMVPLDYQPATKSRKGKS